MLENEARVIGEVKVCRMIAKTICFIEHWWSNRFCERKKS